MKEEEVNIKVNKDIKKNIVKYNLISSIAGNGLVMVIISILLIIFKNKVNLYMWIIKPIYILVAVWCLFDSFIKPFIDIKIYKYKIDDRKIEYVEGIFTIKKVILPISRIQQVTTTKNPILDKLGLVKVEVRTATGEHYLRNLSLEEGEYIVEQITAILFNKSKYNNEIERDKIYEL